MKAHLPVIVRVKNVTIGDTTTGQIWAGNRKMAVVLYASPADADVLWALACEYLGAVNT